MGRADNPPAAKLFSVRPEASFLSPRDNRLPLVTKGGEDNGAKSSVTSPRVLPALLLHPTTVTARAELHLNMGLQETLTAEVERIVSTPYAVSLKVRTLSDPYRRQATSRSRIAADPA